jgi:hypothetical protein
MNNTISTIAIILWAIVVAAIHAVIWWNIKDEYNIAIIKTNSTN